MAESRRLQVLKAVQSTIRGIAGSGYHYPVVVPEQVTLDPTNVLTATVVDGPLYVIEPTPDGSRQFWPAMQVQHAFRGTITGRVDIADVTDPTARATAWENLAADLEKALAVDVTLGGLVYDIRLLEPAPAVVVGMPMVILVQPWEARIHRTYGVP